MGISVQQSKQMKDRVSGIGPRGVGPRWKRGCAARAAHQVVLEWIHRCGERVWRRQIGEAASADAGAWTISVFGGVGTLALSRKDSARVARCD